MKKFERYRRFPPEYWPTPHELEILARLGFDDVSWINDAYPSFALGIGGYVQLFIAPVDPNVREVPEGAGSERFTVHYYPPNGESSNSSWWRNYDDFATATAVAVRLNDTMRKKETAA